MNILSRTTDVLASRGNISFLVMVDYKPIMLRDKRVYVRLESRSGHVQPVFGIYQNTDGVNEFKELPNLVNYIDTLLTNNVIHQYTIDNVDSDENSFICEVNEGLRLINFVRPLFKELSNTIYRDNVTSQISSPSIILSVEDVRNLYNYFETYFCEAYVQLFNDRIVPTIQKSSVNLTVRVLMSLKQFVPVLFTGPCILNPFLDCGRFSKVFKETMFYKKSLENSFEIKDNNVFLMTNKEICECLGLDRFIPFAPGQLVFLLLGIFNPNKYPSTQTHKFVNEGKIYKDTEDMINKGANPATGRRVTSLYALCLSYAFSLGIRETRLLNTYVDIVSTVTLV